MKINLLAVFIFFTPLLANSQKQTQKKPNVVIIMADDLDTRELSCYGGKNIKTMHIDQLASEGLQFDEMYASHATCVPTRASLFTGLYPMKHGSYQNHKPVYPNIKGIGTYLADLEYKVGLTGKDHSTKSFPFDILNGFQKNCIASTDEYQLDDIKQYITANDQPFCLFVMSINPHKPWDLGDPSEFKADRLVLPPNLVDTKETRAEYCKYLAEIRRLDNQVGDLNKLIKEVKLEDNTIFIFLGEQGPQLPGGKWTCWDFGQKSSMLVRWPKVISPKKRSSALVQYEDITPTLIEIAGGKVPAGLDGQSFLSVLKGDDKGSRTYAYGMYNNIPEGPAYPSRSIRDGHYKLILNLTPDQSYAIKWYTNDVVWKSWQAQAQTNTQSAFLYNRVTTRPAVEFYDMRKDPYELKNLANDNNYQAMIGKYKTALDQWMQEQGDPGASVDKPFGK